MNKFLTALLAVALSLPVIAWAQNNNQQPANNSQAQQQEANELSGTAMTGVDTSPHHTMTGMVGDNGKTFTSNNTVWQVSNPKTLKNYANQQVTVRYQFNTTNNTLRIDKVESAGK
jgi:outer membrane lipoprotein-sorting protein